MVNYRYELLSLPPPRHKQQQHHTRHCKRKTLQIIAYALLFGIVVLYYGYKDFFTLSMWQAHTNAATDQMAPHDATNSNAWHARASFTLTTTQRRQSQQMQSEQHNIIATTATTTITTTTAISSPFSITPSQYATSNTSTASIASTTVTTLPTLTTTTTTKATTTTSDNDTYASYYVHSTQCRMPRVDPFTAAMRKRFKPMAAANCDRGEPSLVHVEYNSAARRYTLLVNDTALALTAKAKAKNFAVVRCCYREIVRGGGTGAYADRKATMLPCTPFGGNDTVPVHIEAMYVTCSASQPSGKSKKKKNIVLQEDAFSFVQYKNASNATTSDVRRTNATRMPSLLLIGIDSLSRFNFRRNMPLTFEYLRARAWYELEGYNKMGDNTFPNLMALLTGYNQTTAYARCKPTIVGGLDECPFVWRHFHSAGYRTAYAEDIASISTFNYNKKGFRQPPTDHYLRPLLLAVEQNMKVVRKARLPYCVGRRQYGEYVYDFAQQFAACYRDEPVFGFFWTNSFSHNSYDVSSSMDARMRRYFEDFERSGVLNTSIVFFFSDHGMRFGSVLEMPEGFLEERLPMFFIWLPEWFRRAHPQLARSLHNNRNRLTTPYDIHMTLMHLLQLAERPQLAQLNLAQYRADGCAACHSVLRDMPADRGCRDASIPDHWCTCVPYSTLHPKDALVQHIGAGIVAELNAYTTHSHATGADQCTVLALREVTAAEVRMDNDVNGDVSNNGTQNRIYRIKFTTKPKEARFQATVTYNATAQTVGVDNIEDISRLDRYAGMSTCVNDSQLKKYCICNTNTNTKTKTKTKTKNENETRKASG